MWFQSDELARQRQEQLRQEAARLRQSHDTAHAPPARRTPSFGAVVRCWLLRLRRSRRSCPTQACHELAG